jgi:hypothetical protein
LPLLTGICASVTPLRQTAAHPCDAVLDELGVPRELTDQIIGIVASLRPHIVTV